MGDTRFDVIVVGLGAMGSAVCHHLARRGFHVLGLDQFQPGHDKGSSHGQTRVIRKAYFEHPRYVPLIQQAFDLWRELETDCDVPLLHSCGCLNMGPMDHPAIQGVQRSAHEHALLHEVLNADEIRRRWPAFKCHDADIGIHEKDAGILFPERCIAAHLELADRCGAELRHNVRVQSWRSDGSNAVIDSDAGDFECKHLILTAGPWLPELLADLRLPLRVERQVQLWFEPRDASRFTPEAMPIFIHFVDDRTYYGIPIVPSETPGHACPGLLGGGGAPPYDRAVKIARHHGGLTTTAASVDRSVSAQDEGDVRDYIRRYIPDADGPLVASKVCLYTNTPDDHFIIDRHPRHENVLVAGGFSGHGFKFAPLVGEMMADMVTTGRTQQSIDFFSIARFNLPR